MLRNAPHSGDVKPLAPVPVGMSKALNPNGNNRQTMATTANCWRSAGDLLTFGHVLGDQMPKLSAKLSERKCPACNGTGYPAVKQPAQEGRRIYPARCEKCGGKGRITEAAS
jgi:hypothetical protein